MHVLEPYRVSEASGVAVVAKPAGLATQAPLGIPSVEAWLRGLLPEGAYLGVPHRLDRAVSGVMLMATTPRAARQLSRQFERRGIEKTYVALLAPPVSPVAEATRLAAAGGVVDWHNRLAKVADEPRVEVVDDAAEGRDAHTRARLLGILPSGEWLVALQPVTGRMHQLRVQAAACGLPVVGDDVYGEPAAKPFGPSDIPDARQRPIALHAWRISYHDPDTQSPLTAWAPLPEYWPAAAADALAGCG
jgi:23S rRNA-/tRNA-specific pseudouridylate synthase